ncbi:MAG: hypothetical protein Q9172_007761 [Xanthocarpia lactea]
MAGPTPAQIDYQLQHIQDDRSDEIIAALGVCLAFAIITVPLRFVSRHLTRAPLKGDDWAVVFGLICAIGYVVGQVVAIKYGLGKHSVLVKDPASLARATTASIILYIVSLAATKLSILLLYRRIFPNRGFHAVIWAVGIFVVAFTTANVLFIIFSCNPINGAWNPTIKAKCINNQAAILAVACMTIVSDFIILALPLPLVWKMHLARIRKFQLSIIFLLGTFIPKQRIQMMPKDETLRPAHRTCLGLLTSEPERDTLAYKFASLGTSNIIDTRRARKQSGPQKPAIDQRIDLPLTSDAESLSQTPGNSDYDQRGVQLRPWTSATTTIL